MRTLNMHKSMVVSDCGWVGLQLRRMASYQSYKLYIYDCPNIYLGGCVYVFEYVLNMLN